VSISPTNNSYETLVGLAIHWSSLRAQLASIDSQAGDKSLKNLERTIAENTLATVQQNISEILANAQSTPAGFTTLKSDIERMNKDVEFEKSVFLMTKFPDKPGDRLKDKQLDSLTKAIEEALRPYGLVVRRADQRNFASSKQLWDNVRIHMLGCKYGIAILESKYKDEFNPNVALEYGFMNAIGREVILFIEETFKHRRADIMSTLGKEFNWSASPKTMKKSIIAAIDSWMVDLGKPKIILTK
jgi:nucleoside 2-deoxyribosyltransferase